MKRYAQVLMLITSCCLLFAPGCQAERCGPHSLCSCSRLTASTIAMNCRGRMLNVSDICHICDSQMTINVTYITSLDVSHINNTMPVIPNYCFQGKRCKNLEKLSMSSNGINRLEDFAFRNLSKLKSLNMDNNSLIVNGSFMNPRIFTDLPNLEVLRLQGNVLRKPFNAPVLYNIPPDYFPSLRELFLDGQARITFGSNFRGFVHLVKLDFTGKYSRCNITTLTNSTFKNIQQVRYLNLAFCKLSDVDSGAFEELSNLKLLNLSYNEGLGFVSLRNVSYGLQFARSLEVLDYSKVHKQFGLSTELRRCDVWYLQNTTIKRLHLDNNRLALIERNALLLFPASIEVVSAKRNQFNYGPYVVQVKCLGNLKKVDINQQNYFANPSYYDAEVDIKEKVRENRDTCEVPDPKSTRPHCKYLTDDHFVMFFDFSWPANLTSLSIRGSSLPIVSPPSPNDKPGFNLKSSLRSLDSSHNVLSAFHTPYVRLLSLEHLNISNNFATEIHQNVFEAAPNLLTLDLSNNFLGKPLSNDTNGQIWKPLHQLKVLNLSANLLTSIPNITTLNNLTSINFAFNGISEVPSSLATLEHLTEIDLRQNTISTLPPELFKQLEETTKRLSRNVSIDLSDNSLEISCENLNFLEWMIGHPSYFKHLDTYAYRFNTEVHIMSLSQLEQRVNSLNKTCKRYTAIIIVSVIVITGFIFSIIAGFVYRYRWRLRYLYYMAKARYSGYDHLSSVSTDYKYDAFISYAEEDYLFIKDEIVVEVEDKYGFQLCLHQRNFVPGNYIAENILQAIKNSRMMVIVLTDSFLRSKWCIYEYNMARMESIYSRNGENFIVCIMYEEIDNMFLSPDLVETLSSETFLKYPQEENEKQYFWELLKQALDS